MKDQAEWWNPKARALHTSERSLLGVEAAIRPKRLVFRFLVTTKALRNMALPNLQMEYKRLPHPQLDSRHSPSSCMSLEGRAALWENSEAL